MILLHMLFDIFFLFYVLDNLYACVVVFILPINSALNPILYTIAAPTELRRRIEKWLERTLVCLQRFECVVRSGNLQCVLFHQKVTICRHFLN